MNPYIVFNLAFERDMEIRRQVELNRQHHPDRDPSAQDPTRSRTQTLPGWNSVRPSQRKITHPPAPPVAPDHP